MSYKSIDTHTGIFELLYYGRGRTFSNMHLLSYSIAMWWTTSLSHGQTHPTFDTTIDLLAILEKSLDRALFLYIFICEVRSSGV